MKKILLNTALTIGLMFPCLTAGAEELALPQPDNSSALMKIINARQSGRAYSTKPLSEQALSNILWAAFGTNSHGKRTIPTGRNLQDLKVFVVYNNKVWLYDGKNNVLNQHSDADLMPYLATQDFVKQAPVHLIYAGGKKYAEAHSGSAYENVYLYAAENGLATVIRGMIDRDGLHKALKLNDDEVVTYHQTIGYPEK